MRKIHYVFYFIFLYGVNCHAQKNTSTDSSSYQRFPSIAIYGSVGTSIFKNLTQVLVERKIFYSYNENFNMILRAGYGIVTGGRNYPKYYAFSTGFYTGKKSSHFEMTFGFSIVELSDNAPMGSLGYRYQKPYGLFVFRTGLGYPEVAYISAGLTFPNTKKHKRIKNQYEWF